MYVSGNCVRSITRDAHATQLYSTQTRGITGMDYDVRHAASPAWTMTSGEGGMYVSGNCVRSITRDAHATQLYSTQTRGITGMDYDVRHAASPAWTMTSGEGGMYVSGNCVRSITRDAHATQLYSTQTRGITGMDYDVRRGRLFVSSSSTNSLEAVNGTHGRVEVTNQGTPTKVAVDWVTGNVYFVDSTPSAPKIRVCDVTRKRCAVVIDLPAGSQVTALAVDPANAYILYCVHHDLEYILWLSSLSGHRTKDLATVSNCSALAADSFRHRALYADAPARLVAVPYDSPTPASKILIESDANFQSPHSLALFEDHIYFLVANTFKLSRCLLYSTKTCEPFFYRIFDANLFVLNHESAQRGDVKNSCEGSTCDGVCVLGQEGPQCVCQNGRLSVDGKDCDVVEKELLPLFNGWSAADAAAAGGAWVPLLVGTFVLMAVCFGIVVLRRCRGRGDTALPSAVQRLVSSGRGGGGRRVGPSTCGYLRPVGGLLRRSGAAPLPGPGRHCSARCVDGTKSALNCELCVDVASFACSRWSSAYIAALFNGWSAADAAAAGGAWVPLLVGTFVLMAVCFGIVVLRRCRGRGVTALP
ncbi:unnamed protein product [Plutella xylostella]|uniref:(diamondback moth) hypothetical protein n=1 Tax=Plutella xylostella TaxID=51655 RepID=A0A8S4FAB0_PLUXY|nr:unnamed protein product [Plutella xylostella]